MEQIAIYVGNTKIYWSAIIITIGVMTCFTTALAFYSGRKKRSAALWLFLPIATVLSLVISRAIHWYCHEEQYESFFSAISDMSHGSFVLPGVLFGLIIAAYLLKALKALDSVDTLFDCIAPGAALGMVLIRLSPLYNSSCRGKIVITNEAFQRLPFASPLSTGSVTEYHLATFCIEAILMLAVFILTLAFSLRLKRVRMLDGRKSDGDTARYFLLLYSLVELITDSTRNDSSYMHFNGFVSLVQIVCAVSVLAVLIHYSRRSVKYYGISRYHYIDWVCYFISLVGVGLSEYFVQRHGNLAMLCYSTMTVSSIIMFFTVFWMYGSLVKPLIPLRRRSRNADDDAGAEEGCPACSAEDY